MHANLVWKGKSQFLATPPSGNSITFDTHPDHGGENAGPSPLETMLCTLAACTAMDVISILQKKRQAVHNYRIEITGDREPEGTWPRPFTKITVKHIFEGENLDEGAIKRAIELSDEKYCSVSATLRESPEIVSEWQIS